MLDELKKQSTLITTFLVLASVAVGIYVLQVVWNVLGFFSDALVILFSAWILSFILGPAVEFLSRKLHTSKLVAAAIVYLVFFALFAFAIFNFIPVVTSQYFAFVKVLPKYQHTFPYYVNRATQITLTAVGNSLTLIPAIGSFLVGLIMVLIASFYFVVDKDNINKELYFLLPKKYREQARYVQEVVDNTFGSFIRVQIIFGVIAGIATWIIMTAFGVGFAASVALIAGILTIIPIVGGLFALVPPVAIAFLMDPWKALFVLISLVVMQQIIFNIVFPRVVGNALKLHPVVVIFSFFIGYKIAGSFGVIFAVPVIAVVLVILHRISHHFLEDGH
ncbi:MAG TPA: AI-2E family transporter [Patescibacteria group bacterium]|nr:AI-2E family transporter [Patescibacteria group bacterium]